MSAVLAMGLLAQAAGPSATSAPPSPPTDVVVQAARPRGSVTGDVRPERVLGTLDVRAYGASDVRELIGALGAQVGSGRGGGGGEPVLLLNGRRVSGFAEIATIPTEAIERVELFPEELALRYGYPANQKVVNVVVAERFAPRVAQGSLSGPTEGGRDAGTGAANLLRIRGDARLSLNAEYARADNLLESERGVLQAPGVRADAGRFRTLLPATERTALTGTLAGPILGDVAASLNGRFEAGRTDALLGPGNLDPLRRDADNQTFHVGGAAGRRAGNWNWSFTGNYDRSRNVTRTDQPSGARDSARSIDSLADADLLLSGPVLRLPAGRASATMRVSGSARDFDARSVVGGVFDRGELSRDRGAVQMGLDVPLAARGPSGPTGIGALSLNASVRAERLSDAGDLRAWNLGLNWSPLPALSLLATLASEEAPPTVEQLGAPLVVTPAFRFYDFARGETVDVSRLVGGNRLLRPEDRRSLSLGLTARPLEPADLMLTLNYLDTRTDDPVSAFPAATPEIQAAFPDRFRRDVSGRLDQIDVTPLNFASARQRQLRWGINFVRPLGPVPPDAQNVRTIVGTSMADVQRQLPPGAVVRTMDAGSPAARRYENLSSRLFLSLNHVWRLEDRVLVRDGGPVLDFLDGSAADSRGGRPSHEVSAVAGAFKRGLGARLTATWQDGTEVLGGASGPLRFSDLYTMDLNLFINPSARLGGQSAPSWARGTRLSLNILNIFNRRTRARDAAGDTPINFQSAYLNPLGRLVTFSVRKVF